MFSDRFRTAFSALALLAITSGIGCGPEVATNQTSSDQTSANQISGQPVPNSNAACEAPMLVLKLVESKDVSGGEGAPAPYSSENHSKIILIATVGEPSAQQAEKKELPLVIEEVLRGTKLIERGDVVVKDSRKGTFQSITVTIEAQSEEQLRLIHQDLMDTGLVSMVL